MDYLMFGFMAFVGVHANQLIKRLSYVVHASEKVIGRFMQVYANIRSSLEELRMRAEHW